MVETCRVVCAVHFTGVLESRLRAPATGGGSSVGNRLSLDLLGGSRSFGPLCGCGSSLGSLRGHDTSLGPLGGCGSSLGALRGCTSFLGSLWGYGLSLGSLKRGGCGSTLGPLDGCDSSLGALGGCGLSPVCSLCSTDLSAMPIALCKVSRETRSSGLTKEDKSFNLFRIEYAEDCVCVWEKQNIKKIDSQLLLHTYWTFFNNHQEPNIPAVNQLYTPFKVNKESNKINVHSLGLARVLGLMM